MVRRRSGLFLRDLEDADLIALVRDGDDAAREELARRNRATIESLARTYCSRLAHRGGYCPRTECQEAYPVAFVLVRERVVGGPGRTGLAELWLNRRNQELDFRQFIARNTGGWQTDVLRAWNTARGLAARVRLGKAGPEVERELVLLLDRTGGLPTGNDTTWAPPRSAQQWAEALYDDACQPAQSTIDELRVARALDAPEDLDQRRFLELATAVDDLIARLAPRTYGGHVDRARAATRLFSHGGLDHA